MNQIIIEILLVTSTFNKSILLGTLALIYIIYMRDKYKCLAQVRSSVEKVIKPKRIKLPKQTANKIVLYKGCTIEKHEARFIIVKPSGKRLMKIFNSLAGAKKEINVVAPFLIVPKVKGRKVHNIRFVK